MLPEPVASDRGVDLPLLIRRAARDHADLPAVRDGVKAFRFAELAARAERLANALDGLGVPPGAAVGVLAENRAEYVEIDLGLALARRVRVALNVRLHLDEHRFVVGDTDMRALIHSARFAEQAAALAEEAGLVAICLDGPEGTALDYPALLADASPSPVPRPGSVEDPAWISYTSGTTGHPKGIVLSRRSIREVALNLLLELGPVLPGDRIVLPQPLSHGAGYYVLPWIISGAEVYVMRHYDPEETLAAAVSGNGRSSLFKCVPAMIPPLLEASAGTAFGYDTIVYAAAPMPRPVLEAARERFGPVLVQIYGQSEAPVTITCLHKRDHDGDQRFSVGRPFRAVGVEIRSDEGETLPAGEEGEVAVTGSHLMSRYHRLPELTAAVLRDGWIMTKDMGVIDDRGFVHLLGRRDEMINSGGFNISPREVEQVISRFPGVEEAAVIGVPDDRWGQVGMAMVKLRDGTVATDRDLIEFVRPRLGFRTPKVVKVVEAVPRNSYGKVDRKKAVELLGAENGPRP